jgi:CheY-like chemotaxis protein/chemotaxis protein CheY-P-specific phosphatase CheC
MEEYAKLTAVLAKAAQQACDESSMLLGQTMSVAGGDQVGTNRLTYFSDLENALLIAAVEAKEEYAGQFYLLFSLRDAILLSGLLLGIPPARVSEKRKLAIIENDDYDAFGEVLNQVIGSFNTVFKPSFPNKIHLKLVKPKKYVPEVDQLTDEEPIPDGEYRLFRAPLAVDGYEMDRLDILVPLELALQLDPPPEAPVVETVEVEAVAAEAVPGAADIPPSESMPQDETIIILEDDARERENIRKYLADTGLKLLDAPLDADIRELFAQGFARLAVVGVADTEDRELALCIKISSLRLDQPMPIIMCAPEWTRSGVLKAIKYGARDILIKPYSEAELISKVRKYLKAA